MGSYSMKDGQPSKSHVLEGVKGLKAFTVNGKYSGILFFKKVKTSIGLGLALRRDLSRMQKRLK